LNARGALFTKRKIDGNSLFKRWIRENNELCTGFGYRPTPGSIELAEISISSLSKTIFFVKPDFCYHDLDFYSCRSAEFFVANIDG
jgi:hypothetical protein